MTQSRFTSNEAVAFEFERSSETQINYQNLMVSHVFINFGTAPTTAGDVQIFISDDKGKDLIWETEAQNKTHLPFTPTLYIPVSKGAKLIIEYANADSVAVTARILWRV